MRELRLWYRCTAIFVVREEPGGNATQFLISKRSQQKDICPGWLDLGFGGIVTADEIFDVDGSAKREAEEEMGLPDLGRVRVPRGLLGSKGLLSSFSTLVPKFAFKHRYEDDNTNGWVYAYYMPWSREIESAMGLRIKP